MRERTFTLTVAAIAIAFTAFFCAVVVPPLLADPDILGALAAGFVNPYASGYSADVLCCWAVLAVWVWFEATTRDIRYGWLCLLLAMVPGVAVGFAGYLLLRQRQLQGERLNQPLRTP